jgi:hypothetical protein
MYWQGGDLPLAADDPFIYISGRNLCSKGKVLTEIEEYLNL